METSNTVDSACTAASRPPQRIIPSLPLIDESNTQSDDDERYEEMEANNSQDAEPEEDLETDNAGNEAAASYSIPPPPERIVPAESFQDLYEPMEDSSEVDEASRQGSPNDIMYEGSNGYHEDNESDMQEYRPGFRPQEATSSNRPIRHLPSALNSTASPASTSSEPILDLPGSFTTSQNRSARSQQPGSSRWREGQTSTSAIVIQDSPTPPLRPLASPQARLAASITGKCGVLASMDAPPASPPPEDQTSTLGELVCPICLGSPAPLVITECGHTFCGPCLHAAIVAQPITAQLMQDIPTVAGKDLEGTCPVCRHPLTGGWGRSMRGGILKMEMVEIAI